MKQSARQVCRQRKPRDGITRGRGDVSRETPTQAQKRGDFAGLPTGRGNVSGVASTLRRTRNPNPSATSIPIETRFSFRSPSAGHLSPRSGGSETMMRPPTAANRTAHSAVTAGGPKDLDVIRSKMWSALSSRETTSALPRHTRAPPGAPARPRVSCRKSVRRSIESSSTPGVPHLSSRTRPGRPPPLPRSRKRSGGAEL